MGATSAVGAFVAAADTVFVVAGVGILASKCKILSINSALVRAVILIPLDLQISLSSTTVFD